MIFLCTDFGIGSPYVGQIKAVLCREAPTMPVIELFSDLPRFDPRAAAYLLAAYTREIPQEGVMLGVVDPGVGGTRVPVMLRADNRWYVGPDNGLFAIIARRAAEAACYEIDWRPRRLSASFHGRDLFAPVVARLAKNEEVEAHPLPELIQAYGDWPDELNEVIYIDQFGNAVTGMRAMAVDRSTTLKVGGQRLLYAETFSRVPEGTPFWYENANGLVEIAVNQASAARLLNLIIGTPVSILS